MSEIASGSIRFNTDSAKMEIYNGEQWWEVDSTSPEEQTGGTRGFFAGGVTTNVIQSFSMATTGQSADFGDLTIARYAPGGVSDSHGGLTE